MKDRWIALAVVSSLVGSTFSIAVASIFLGLAIALWIAAAVQSRSFRFEMPIFGWFLLAYCAFVIVAILFSLDPPRSSKYLLKLFKFLLVPLMFTFLSTRDVRWTMRLVLVVLGLSAAFGLLQYFWLFDVHLMNRIRGFMSHWMTFSGQLMLATVALTAIVLFCPDRGEERESRSVWAPILGVMLFALLLTFTRNAWIGAATGVGMLLLFYRWRLFVPIAAVGAALLFLTANPFRDRILDGFDLNDTTTLTRIEFLQTGRSMIAEHPLTGVGPRMVPIESVRHRYSNRFEDSLYIHLHNSPLQIAAETGLLALLPWTLMWCFLAWDYVRQVRMSSGYLRMLYLNALCAMCAFLLSGLLEYNFGDAEVLVLLLFFLTAPYVVARESESPA